jgi:16S rRNA (guanine1207-N2)-methyltransferase
VTRPPSPSHYFSPAPARSARPRLVRFRLGERQFHFRTAAGVFSRTAVDRGTRLLLEAVDPAGADRILDLGCGYGAIGIVMAARSPRARVMLVDVNPRAVALAVENIALNAVVNAEARCGDGLAPVAGVDFDLILTNPPIRAGRAVVMRLLREARDCLRPQGRLYLVARTGQGARTLGRLTADLYGRITEVARGGGFRVYEASRV